MTKRFTLRMYGALLASASAAFGFSTHDASVSRRFDRTEATMGSNIVVAVTITNAEPEALRGLFFMDQIPSSLSVTTMSLKVNGFSVSNYVFEAGWPGDVYGTCTPWRWVLECPTGFPQNNSVNSSGIVEIVYSISSLAAGVFGLNAFSWAGWYPGTNETAFGYSETGDQQAITFVDPVDKKPIGTILMIR